MNGEDAPISKINRMAMLYKSIMIKSKRYCPVCFIPTKSQAETLDHVKATHFELVFEEGTDKIPNE